MSTLEEGEAHIRVVVDKLGVGHVRYTLPFFNSSAGPATTTVTLTNHRTSPLVVIDAKLKHHRKAMLVESSLADEAFSAFVHALEFGVLDDEVTPGKQRVAFLVAETDDASSDVALSVAAACSVRNPVVVVDALIENAPAGSTARFVVPAPFARARIDVVTDGAVAIDGARRRHLTRTRRETPQLNNDGTRADDAFVVDTAMPALVVGGSAVSFVSDVADNNPTTNARGDDDAPPSHTVARARIDIARPLSDVPARLRVVFVVDESVSVGREGAMLARALVQETLRALPDDARYAVVVAGRVPTLLVAPWTERHAFALPTLRLRNGSDVDAAIAYARTIAVDAEPLSGRVIVVSDFQTSDRTASSSTVMRTSSASPLMHLVHIPADVGHARGAVSFDRAFASDDARAATAEASGGVLISLRENGEGDDEGLDALARHLVRPMRIDRPTLHVRRHVQQNVQQDVQRHVLRRDPDLAGEEARAPAVLIVEVSGTDGVVTDDVFPDFLDVGQGLRASARLDGTVDQLEVRGFIWGVPHRWPLRYRGKAQRLSTGVLVNQSLRHDLVDAEVEAIATRAHVVSRRTSLVDVPAWRPATPPDVEMSGCGCCGGGSSSCGGRSSTRCGISCPGVIIYRTEEILDAIATEAAAACAVDDVAFVVEFGDLEILDVVVEQGGRCVADYVWEERLDRRGHDVSFEMHMRARGHFSAPTAAATSSTGLSIAPSTTDP